MPVLIQHEVLQLKGKKALGPQQRSPPASHRPHPGATRLDPSGRGPSALQVRLHLDVTVDDVPRVEILQSRNDLSPIEAGTLLREDTFSREVEKQLEGKAESGGSTRAGMPDPKFTPASSERLATTPRKGLLVNTHLSSIGVLHDKAEAVVGLECVFQGLERQGAEIPLRNGAPREAAPCPPWPCILRINTKPVHTTLFLFHLVCSDSVLREGGFMRVSVRDRGGGEGLYFREAHSPEVSV